MSTSLSSLSRRVRSGVAGVAAAALLLTGGAVAGSTVTARDSGATIQKRDTGWDFAGRGDTGWDRIGVTTAVRDTGWDFAAGSVVQRRGDTGWD